MSKVFLLILSVTLSISIYAQNYRRYYELVDSALYFTCIGNYMKADSLYEKTFSQFNGFTRHYGSAIFNIYQQNLENPEKGTEKGKWYAAKASQVGCNRIYIEKTCIDLLPGFDKKKFREIEKINKKEAKRAHRKEIRGVHQREIRIHQRDIRRMRIRDLWAHGLFPKRIPRADSINFIKLKEFLKSDSLVLRAILTENMYMLGEYLFPHISMDWNRFQELAPYYVRMIENGWIERGFLIDIVDYHNIRKGKLVYMDEYGNVTQYVENDKLSDDRGLYYSILGDAAIYDYRSRESVLLPLNPSMSMQEIDAFRKSVFLPSFNIYRQIYPNKRLPSTTEYIQIEKAVWPKK